MKNFLIMLTILVAAIPAMADTRDPGSLPERPLPVLQLDRPGSRTDFECNVTQRASVTIQVVQVEISCSASKPTCREATQEAASCIREGIALLRKAIF